MKKGILFVISCFFFAIVAQAQTAVTGVSLDTTNLTLGISETYRLTPAIIPNTATNQVMIWTTSNANIATVYHGFITAKKTGTVDIIVTTKDGGFKDTCVVTVTTIPVTGVSLDKKLLRLECGACYQLKTTIAPLNATDKSVSYTSEGLYIATVSPSGVICAGDPDTTLIIVETNDGSFKDTCVVIVNVPYTTAVREVSLDKERITLVEGETSLLEETVLPNNATNKKVTWYSDNFRVATVSSGLLTAKSSGSTIIYVRTVDKGKTDSCFVTVLQEDFIVVDPETVTSENGTIPFSIKTPENISLTGSFLIEFPEGLTLNDNTTKLSNEYEATSLLVITDKGDNRWLVEIKEKTPVLYSSTTQNIMNIGFKTDKATANGEYDILFSQINLKLNDGSELKKDQLIQKVKINIDDTANDLIEAGNVHVYLTNNRLYIQSMQAETVYVYSFNGVLRYEKEKAAGEIVFDVDAQGSALIVKGSSGWVRKVAN